MKTFLVILWVTLVPVIATAQKKQLTFEQLFQAKLPAILKSLPEIGGWIDDDHYIQVVEVEGKDVPMSVNAATGKITPYVSPAPTKEAPHIEDAQNVTISPDGKFAAFTRKNNLYVRDLASGMDKALTSDGSDVILNGYASWIYYEEILGRASHYKAFWWSPDSKSISFMRFDDSEVPVFPIYFADGQHGYLEQQRYPKAGDKNPQVKIGFANISDGRLSWADFNAADDQYFGTPAWTTNNELFVQWMNREQDSLLVFSVNRDNGKKTLVYTETQPTWITLDNTDRFYFLQSGKGFILHSDKDGWENLYLHDMNGKLVNKLISGNYWGTTILKVDEKSNTVYFKARKENSARFDLYKVDINGKNVVRLTSGNFSYDNINISPTGKHFITIFSNLNAPPEMSLFSNKGREIRKLGSSRGAEFDKYALPVRRLMTVKSSDGVFDLPLIITYPSNFDSTKKYPVWITVYGGPDAGTVFDKWTPAGGLMQWWAQEGVIQVAMDNRSSGHFGRKGINYIYKQMGKWEVEDYMTCAGWLARQPWVDPTKMGITGGSFGGYITCMALTYGASVFTHGIANYAVTDWQLYDTHYTERFMNTPQTNKEGYRNTSSLTHVDKYKGVLRIVHGTTDDNVHMQNSIQLIDALQDSRKSFEMMLYPNQRHGIGNQKTAHNMLETIRFIYRYMLERELPEQFGG